MNKISAEFDYLLEKVSESEIADVPFRHVEITDFLAKEHFEAIIGERQIALDSAADAEALLDSLEVNGYEIIQFPGAITSKRHYLDWLNGFKDASAHAEATISQSHITTEGFGVVYRLARYESPIFDRTERLLRVGPVEEAGRGQV